MDEPEHVTPALNRSILTWGRGAVLTSAGGLIAFFVAGWLRSHLITGLTAGILSIPWLWLRRLLVGLIIDIPVALILIATVAVAARFVVSKPIQTVVGLIAVLWGLDALAAWLLGGDMSLWTDPLILVGRLLAVVAAFFAAALVAGWRPRQDPTTDEAEQTKASDEPTDDEERSI